MLDGLATLTSPAVLAFLLGLVAALLRSDLKLPDQVHGFLSLYLLLAIGLKGGVGLRDADVGDLALPVVATLVLPAVNGTLGVLVGAAAGLSTGGAALLGCLRAARPTSRRPRRCGSHCRPRTRRTT